MSGVKAEQELYVLIDYENLRLEDVGDIVPTIDYVVSLIYDTEPFLKQNFLSVIVRIYGGWDERILTENGTEKNDFTIIGQKMTRVIGLSYPVRRKDPHCRIQVELARGQAINPNVFFPFTLRRRQTLGQRIRVCKKDEDCCPNATNTLDFIRKLKKSNKCPHCGKPSSNIIWYAEQKLVDVLLATDLLHYALLSPSALFAVVSSDDDFLPALFHVGYLGRNIYHIHTSYTTHSAYLQMAPTGKYHTLSLRS